MKLLSFIVNTGYFEEALNFYSSRFDKKKDPDIAYIIGDIYIKRNNPETAKRFYEFALKNPENDGALINLIKLYLEEKNFDKARDVCNNIIQHDDATPLPYALLAEVYFKIGDNGTAIEKRR